MHVMVAGWLVRAALVAGTNPALALLQGPAPAPGPANAPAADPSAQDPSATVAQPAPPPGQPEGPAAPPAAAPGPNEPRGVANLYETDADAPEGGKPISLDEAIDLALRQHPQLAVANERTKAVESRIGQAQSGYLPRIDVWLQYLRASEQGSVTSIHGVPGLSRVGGATRPGVGVDDSFNNYIAALVVQQAIWDFGRTQGSVREQKAYVKVAQMNEALAKQQVIFGVKAAFYAVQAARDTIALAEDGREIALQILEVAEASRRTGLAPPNEAPRAEATVAAADVALIRAKAQLEIAKVGVANAVGATDVVFRPREVYGEPPPIPSEEELLTTALENRPELAALKHQRDGLQQGLKSVKAQQYPRFDARLGVNSRGQFLTEAGQDPFQRFNWNVGVILQVPVFQGLLVKKQKEEIHARTHALDNGREVIQQAIMQEVKRAIAAVQAADRAAQASQRGVDAAKLALETLEGRYKEGLAKLVELTDAQNAYIEARSQLVRADFDRQLARATLAVAVGKPRGAF